MIFAQFDGGWLAVRQADHGLQTGHFAAHWGNETTPRFEPPEQVIAAASRHDNGWIHWDDHEATLDPATGQPWHFYRLPPHEHVPLYRRGIQAAADHDPYTGLLVSMHGAGLYNDRYGTFRLAEQHFSADERVLVDEFLAEQALFQQSLAERASGTELHTHVTTDPNVWRNYLLLQVWDRLSLQYAFRLAADGRIEPVPLPDGSSSTLLCVNRGQFSLSLDPYPFDESSLTFPVSARRLPDRQYRSAEEFLELLSKTPIDQLECRATRLE
jgi:Protein of unknown function (DUF3891)